MNDMTEPTSTSAPNEETRAAIRAARELVPVGVQGVQITDLAQQVDYAQTMARAKAALPAHLRGNIGDCLAIIDIASRAGLSPYMVASKTYLQNDRLCFESQLFHAFAQASGLLAGDLVVEYEGTDAERVCVITGWLRSDPSRPRVHKSPPLREAHPGWVVKRQHEDGGTAKRRMAYEAGLKLKAEGGLKEGEELFCQGSPLWGRKPDVQLFYDTSRDWVRIYAPRSVLGIYTPEEVAEYGPEFARDVTPPTSGLKERLTSGDVSREEGHGAGGDARAAMDAARAGEGAGDGGKAGKASSRKKDKGAESLPKTPKQWDAYARKKIAEGTDPDQLQEWWRGDIALRNDCGVTEEFRKPVQAELDRRCKELRPE